MKKLSLFAVAFAFCAAVFAKPMDANAALTPPTNLIQEDAETTKSSCSIDLKWDHTATCYCVEYSTDKVNWTLKDDEWYLSYVTLSDLTPGSTYYVRVTPIDDDVKGTPAILTAITAPRNTSIVTQTGASDSSTQVSIAWQPSAGATGYLVTYGTSSSFSNSSIYTQTTATALTMNVAKNSSFYVFVVPYRGNWLSKSYYGLEVVTAPTCPTDLRVYETNASSKTVTFKWNPSSATYNTDGYEFEVYRVTNKKGKTKRLKFVDISNKYVYETDVKSAKLFSAGYKFRVRAYVTINGKKYGAWSNFYTYVPSAKIKSKLKNRTNSSATLSWNKVLGATSYTVYHKTSPSGKWKAVKKNVKGTSATVKYNKSSYYNYYYVKANKAKIDKKKYSSPNPNSNSAYSYSYFKKVYY